MQKTGNLILDQTDLKILRLLQEDGRLNVKQIALQVYKSEPAAHERIRKLQERGFIRRYSAILDRMLMGRPTLMVALVKLKEYSAVTLREFAAVMSALPEVQVCLHLSGEFDFLLQLTLR